MSWTLIYNVPLDEFISGWVRSIMPINVGCEFRDQSSIPNVCQIRDADLEQDG